jgi:hypothetical protein
LTPAPHDWVLAKLLKLTGTAHSHYKIFPVTDPVKKAFGWGSIESR